MKPDLATRPLPGTDRIVTRIGLGAMHLSLPGRPDRPRALEVIRAAVAAGIGFIDTADAYALDDAEHGHNEVLVVEALRGMGIDPTGPAAPVVATKGGRSRPGGRWSLDARPERLRDACHASLRRMRIERIPLYQLHQPDPEVPLAESVGALSRLRDEGKVEAIGLSNVSLAQLREAADVAPIAAVQNGHSAWSLAGPPSPMIGECAAAGRLFIAYAPLGGRSRVAALRSHARLRAEAARWDSTPAELALATLLAASEAVVAIPGATRVETVASSARAAGLHLAPADVRKIRRLLASLPGGPGPLRRLASHLRHLARTLGSPGRAPAHREVPDGPTQPNSSRTISE